ncbi:MAG: hypothetical protein IJW39_00660 [Opitutales bacterium]|nr:hypothetical protein [Opitutales bacterium]
MSLAKIAKNHEVFLIFRLKLAALNLTLNKKAFPRGKIPTGTLFFNHE